MNPKIRKDFPILQKTMHGQPLIYFDTAATAQKPDLVINAISEFYKNHYGTVHRAVYDLSLCATTAYQEIRNKAKNFIHAAKPEEIIFTRCTTDSINLAASSFGKAFVKPGDEILITAMEHHSNIVPWQMMCAERQAKLKVSPINNNGELLVDAFQKLLTPKTKLVALTHISNALGTINPIKILTKMAHDAGAKVLVDGAQSAPHHQIDVQDLDVDFFAFSGHKLYGPTGIGILYGKEKLLEEMPPYQGGGDMIEKVSFEKTTYNRLPLKFEAGTPMIAEIIGLGASIDYLNKLTLEAICKHEVELLHYATKKMEHIDGLKIIGNAKEKGAIISFTIEGMHPLDVGTFLDLQGIAVRTGHHCAQPLMNFFGIPGTVRASFGLYNTKEEIDHFIDVLHGIVRKFRT